MHPFSKDQAGAWWTDEAPRPRKQAHDGPDPRRTVSADPERRRAEGLLRRTVDLLPE